MEDVELPVSPLQILHKNGWVFQVRDLDDSPLKVSFMEGKDVYCEKQHKRRLSKLQSLGKEMV